MWWEQGGPNHSTVEVGVGNEVEEVVKKTSDGWRGDEPKEGEERKSVKEGE